MHTYIHTYIPIYIYSDRYRRNFFFLLHKQAPPLCLSKLLCIEADPDYPIVDIEGGEPATARGGRGYPD